MTYLRHITFRCIAACLTTALFACGGNAEPAHSPILDANPPDTAATAAPTAKTPAAPAPLTSAESAARAFFDALAKHDVDAALRASSDEAFARGQTRKYANVTAVHFDGPAKADDWPGFDASFFWATVTTDDKSERLLLAVTHEADGWRASGMRDETLRAKVAADRAPPPAAPPPPVTSEVKGKLMTKPTAGAVRVQLDGATPGVGDHVELSRRIDPSIPLIGGSWLVIADTVVTAVSGKDVTLKIVAQKSEMKINGKPLDHYTVGVPISVKWTKAP